MAIQTTCIGAYPKPDYVPIRDWFQVKDGLSETSGLVTRLANEATAREDAEAEALYAKATGAAVTDQTACGVDVPTDGEQRRENYIHYHCRHLTGFDFVDLTKRTVRDGAYTTELPTIRGKIEPKVESKTGEDGGHFLDRDYRVAQSFTERPVKITVPGPTTIMDTCADVYYGDERALAFDLADALNHEIRVLAEAGCKYIQVDEPLFARNVERALEFGVECLDRCFDGVGAHVTRVMHMCCGYPGHIDDDAYHKADPSCYFRLAEAVDRSTIDQISIEDAHRYNDLSLLESFRTSTVIFGSIAIAQSRVETVDEVAARLNAALEHIDRDRLIAAPDCGLAILGRDLAMEKLGVMCQAAQAV